MFKHCPNCTWETGVQEKKFCPKDGSSLVPDKQCACGAYMSPGNLYCELCGEQVKKHTI